MLTLARAFMISFFNFIIIINQGSSLTEEYFIKLKKNGDLRKTWKIKLRISEVLRNLLLSFKKSAKNLNLNSYILTSNKQ